MLLTEFITQALFYLSIRSNIFVASLSEDWIEEDSPSSKSIVIKILENSSKDVSSAESVENSTERDRVEESNFYGMANEETNTFSMEEGARQLLDDLYDARHQLLSEELYNASMYSNDSISESESHEEEEEDNIIYGGDPQKLTPQYSQVQV
jgi:hypothetical protein